MNNEYSTVGLYNHNIESYKKVKESLSKENIAAIVHATGTGKSYNALQLAYDNQDKKIIYVVPSNGIIEHLKKIIDDNPNLNFERDFSNLEFRTYQSFINMDIEKIKSLDINMLILDEFHHLGAPVWGKRIESVIETHPNIKVFGMTAYTVRDRGTQYERDMANPDTNELFSNKVVSRYDLCDAMIDGVLPKPIYRSAYVVEKLQDEEQNLEKIFQTMSPEDELYNECKETLDAAKKKNASVPSNVDVIKKNIKPNGKYIYFCPPSAEEGVNTISDIQEEVKKWCKEMGLSEDQIEFYSTTNEMGELGKRNREAFYNDVNLNGKNVNNKLRIMFAINQYNEGVHAPNIDGVIMGRGTTSDIVYFEQLGRALSVRGDTKLKFDEYEKYSREELVEICQNRDINIQDNTPKEEIIEKLIAPVIIDLANNFDFIKQLENNLKNRVKEIQNSPLGNKRIIKIKDVSFDIEIENQNLFEMLKQLRENMTMNWEKMYEYAKIYYEKYGNLEVPQKFKTNNGYEHIEDGKINLGTWINSNRQSTSPDSERGQLLSKIGMRWEKFWIRSTLSWEEMYEYAKIYYEKYGNLEVLQKFKTNNGYEHIEDGKINLGNWIAAQRQSTSPDSERGQLLSQIGMRWKRIKSTLSWEKMYEYAKIYYEKYGNLEVPQQFKTNNGYEHIEDGKINLGTWINSNRQNTSPDSERGQLLSQIGMRWNIKKNKENIEKICADNNTDLNINKNIIEHISIQELQCKILFLQDNGIPIVNDKGQIHEIFSMSSLNMKVQYGINMEELITKYNINLTGKGLI